MTSMSIPQRLSLFMVCCACLSACGVTARMEPYKQTDVVINEGDQVVSLMSIRLQIEDDENLPLEEQTVYAATPLAFEHDWRGPLLPGSTRRFRGSWIRSDSWADLALSWEISELRVWDAHPTNEETDVAETLSLTSEILEPLTSGMLEPADESADD